MTDHQMLFSAPMVRALLAGTKTQTRRVLKPQPSVYNGNPMPPSGLSWVSKPRDEPYFAMHDDQVHWCWWDQWNRQGPDWIKVRVAKGDRIWVRETWSHSGDHVFEIHQARMAMNGRVIYRADDDPEFPHAKYWPSIHMPREFSRLTLTVTDVRVERLQDITEDDALAEGVKPWPLGDFLHMPGFCSVPAASVPAKTLYCYLWDRINGKGAWAANPYVLAYTFTVARGNIDQLARAA